MQIAREHSIPFLETSAKSNINVEKAFIDLAQAILNKVSKGPVCFSIGIISNTVQSKRKESTVEAPPFTEVFAVERVNFQTVMDTSDIKWVGYQIC